MTCFGISPQIRQKPHFYDFHGVEPATKLLYSRLDMGRFVGGLLRFCVQYTPNLTFNLSESITDPSFWGELSRKEGLLKPVPVFFPPRRHVHGGLGDLKLGALEAGELVIAAWSPLRGILKATPRAL